MYGYGYSVGIDWSAAATIDRLRNVLVNADDGAATYQLDLSELEDRILLNACPVKNEVLANMSHEIQIPINAMLGFTEASRDLWTPNSAGLNLPRAVTRTTHVKYFLQS